MRILISAAEASSDAHGAELLRSLRKKNPQERIEAFGIGGPKLQAEGLRVIVDARDMLAMGFTEALGKLPKLFGALRAVTRAAQESPPDAIVVIDYPEFHFKLAKRLKSLGKPLIYYIPPKVWVWRKRRIEVLKKFFTRLLVILPFEEKFYAQENLSVKYVGNPLVDELPFDLTREEARKKLGVHPDDQLLLLMPGSRKSEMKNHLSLFLDAAVGASQELANLGILKGAERLHAMIPLPVTSQLVEVRNQIAKWELKGQSSKKMRFLKIHLSQGNAAECMIASDAGLIKSGTSTLEAGLLLLPHAVVYQVSWVTRWIFNHLVKYEGPIGLVNLVAGANGKEGPDARKPYLILELVLKEATLRAVTEEAIRLLINHTQRDEIRKGLRALREKTLISAGKSPSDLAAEEIMACVSAQRQ